MTSSAAISLLAFLLFAVSTHGQLISFPPINFPTINIPGFPPISFPPITLPPITLPPIGVPPFGIPPVGIPPIGIPPIGIPPVGIPPVGIPPVGIPPVGIPPIAPLTSLVNVVGQLCCTANGSCPGQGLAGVPATLTCLTNNLTTIVSQAITNANGTFTLNATLSPATLVNAVSGIPVCVVTIARSAVNATLCPVLGATGSAVNTTGSTLLSLVQFVGSVVTQVFNATVSLFIVI